MRRSGNLAADAGLWLPGGRREGGREGGEEKRLVCERMRYAHSSVWACTYVTPLTEVGLFWVGDGEKVASKKKGCGERAVIPPSFIPKIHLCVFALFLPFVSETIPLTRSGTAGYHRARRHRRRLS